MDLLTAAFFCFFLFFLFLLFNDRNSARILRRRGYLLIFAAAGTVSFGLNPASGYEEYIMYREYNYIHGAYAEVLTGDETELGAGWYAVRGSLTYHDPVTLTGDVNLILMDGAVLTMAGDAAWGIGNESEPFHDLNIYGQENQTGVLKASGNDKDLIRAGNLAVNSGRILSESGKNALRAVSGIKITQGNVSGTPLFTTAGDMQISGGEISSPEIRSAGNIEIEIGNYYVTGCEVTADSIISTGNIGIRNGVVNAGEITAAGDVEITGGQVTAAADETGKTGAVTGKTITLGWPEYSELSSFIQAADYRLTGDDQVSIIEEQHFTDAAAGDNIFSGMVDPELLDNKKLLPLYSITILDPLGKGTVTADHAYAVEDELVSYTFTPDEGSELVSLRVGEYDRNPYNEDVIKNPDGSYTYRLQMQPQNVTVRGKFGEPVEYLHWDGTMHTDLATELTGEERDLDLSGFYFASKDIQFHFTDGENLTLSRGSRFSFILCDGVTITMSRDTESTFEDPMINANERFITYGQTAQTGTLKLVETGVGIRANKLDHHGGRIEFEDQKGVISAHNEVWMSRGALIVGELQTVMGGIEIDRGEVSANVIDGNFGVELRGKVTADTVYSDGKNIFPSGSYKGRILLSWNSGDDFISVRDYYTNGYFGVYEKQYLMDEDGKTYKGNLTADEIEAIKGKKLTPANIIVGDEIENGTVETVETFSEESNIITLNVSPEEGFKLKSLSVTHGDDVIPWEKGEEENSYTFVMPKDVMPVLQPSLQPKSVTKEPNYESLVFIPADSVLINAEFGILNTVTVDPEISSGTVEVSPEEAFEGDEVVLKARPADGYELSSFIVTRIDTSEEVKVVNGKFIMPAAGVMVSAVFKEKSVTPERSGPIDFFRLEEMPKTGFTSAGRADIAADIAYKPLDLTLELPSLSVSADLMQVPFMNGAYNIDRLGVYGGLLEGSAVPGEGLSIITAHNHLDAETAGPFAMLSMMEEGDHIFVADGENALKSFSVYANVKLSAEDLRSVEEIAGQAENALVLITCEDEDIAGGYINRRVIFAAPL